jgi:hypothetical protein
VVIFAGLFAITARSGGAGAAHGPHHHAGQPAPS